MKWIGAFAALTLTATLGACGADETEGKNPAGLSAAVTGAGAALNVPAARYFDAVKNVCDADEKRLLTLARTFARPDNTEGAAAMQAGIDYLCPSRSVDFKTSLDVARDL